MFFRHSTKVKLPNDWEIDIDVEVYYEDGDPGVYMYSDGSGCPPSPPDLEVVHIWVNSIDVGDHKIPRRWLKDRGWLQIFENWLIFEICYEEEYPSLYEDLYDAAEAYEQGD